MSPFNFDYSKRDCSLPPGCKDLIDVLRRDPKAICKTFFDTYWKLTYDTALKAGLTEGEAWEVIEELMLDVGWKVIRLGFDPTEALVKGLVIDFTLCRISEKLSKRRDKAD